MRPRLVLFVVVLCGWALAIGARLFALQVTGYDTYRAKADRQQRFVIELEPPRGTLVDARGRALAVSVEVDSAWADPRRIEDPAATARAVTRVTGGDTAALARRFGEDRDFVWVARQLDRPVAERLAALDLPGVDFLKEYRRYYPMGQLAAHVLGYAGIDQRGLAGLEHAADDLVAGREGTRTLLRDARRGTAVLPAAAGGDAPQPGASLRLTLDATLQHIVERELARGVADSGAKSGSVVVLDPADGAVLALASFPTVDLNRFPDAPADHWRNRAIMDAYEPGSTFKMVTVAAAVGDGVLDPNDVLDCEMGGITLAGVRIRDHHPFGRLTLREVVAHSSNVGAIKTGLAVGQERLYRAIRAFGFGRPTGIDLPAESAGDVRPLEQWWPLTKAYVSFGQGLSVTPLQMANAFAAVADGGTLWRPFVVAAVERPDGTVETTRPRVLGHPVTAATALQVERMLEGVVEGGTGKAAAIPGYRVAGKTGTAQKASPEGGYSARRFVASFIGFAPARRPALVVAVVIDEPWPSYHGGSVAAPVFARIVEPALLYLGVPPQRDDAGRREEARPAPAPPPVTAAVAPEKPTLGPVPAAAGAAVLATAGGPA